MLSSSQPLVGEWLGTIKNTLTSSAYTPLPVTDYLFIWFDFRDRSILGFTDRSYRLKHNTVVDPSAPMKDEK